MYVWMYVRTHACTVSTYMNYISVRVCLYVYAQKANRYSVYCRMWHYLACMGAHMHVLRDGCVDGWMEACVHVCLHACIHACMYAHTCMQTCAPTTAP